MMRAEVKGSSIELSFARSEALLLGISAVLVGVLTVLAGWQVAFVAAGISLLGAVAVDLVQRSDIEILGR